VNDRQEGVYNSPLFLKKKKIKLNGSTKEKKMKKLKRVLRILLKILVVVINFN
jgi:hypothetical protein